MKHYPVKLSSEFRKLHSYNCMVYSYPVSWRHSSFSSYAAIVGKLPLPQLLFYEKWWHHWARWSILDILWVERIGFQQKRGRKLNSMWPNIKKKTCWRGKINLKIWKWNGRRKSNTKHFYDLVVSHYYAHTNFSCYAQRENLRQDRD